MRDLVATKIAYFLRAGLHPGPQDDAGTQLLAIFRVGHPDTLHVLNLGMPVEKFLDLARIDVLAAADDHVFGAAHDAAVTFCVDGREVTAVHPAGGIDRLTGPRLVVPVPAHDTVTACQ